MNPIARVRAALAAAALFLAAAPAQALVVGNSGSGNCAPFSCLFSQVGDRYQLSYAPEAFDGPIVIGEIRFGRHTPGSLNHVDLELSFHYSAVDFGEAGATAEGNLGDPLGNWGEFTTGGATPSPLIFTGTAFLYDPSLGPLVLDILVTRFQSAAFAPGKYIADNAGLEVLASYYTATDATNQIGGLRTNFLEGAGLVLPPEPSPGAAVPLPGALGLLSLGLFGMGALRARRRTA